MTADEIDTRISRLETQMTALTVLVHTLLPATVPAARHQILRQFGQYCSATEQQMAQDQVPPAMANWHLSFLARLHQSVEAALQQIEEHESANGPAV